MKKLLILIGLVLVFALQVKADEVNLKNGTSWINVKVLNKEETNETITIFTSMHERIILKKDAILGTKKSKFIGTKKSKLISSQEYQTEGKEIEIAQEYNFNNTDIYLIDTSKRIDSYNSFYFEFFGNGLVYSLNYDRLFSEYVGIRFGIMADKYENFAYPILLNFFTSGNHKLEFGIGIVIFNNTQENIFLKTATLGYRYQPKDGILVFRIGFTPFFDKDIGLNPWAGTSIGFSF